NAVAEALLVRELLAVVHDMDAKAGVVRHARDVISDVPGAEDVDVGRRLDGLDEDLHLAAADQSGLLREVVIQLVLHAQRPSRSDRLARFSASVRIAGAAAT